MPDWQESISAMFTFSAVPMSSAVSVNEIALNRFCEVSGLIPDDAN